MGIFALTLKRITKTAESAERNVLRGNSVRWVAARQPVKLVLRIAMVLVWTLKQTELTVGLVGPRLLLLPVMRVRSVPLVCVSYPVRQVFLSVVCDVWICKRVTSFVDPVKPQGSQQPASPAKFAQVVRVKHPVNRGKPTAAVRV